MYDYLYRWYVPEFQRWPNRDPLGDIGSFEHNVPKFLHNPPSSFAGRMNAKLLDDWSRVNLNLYEFVGNNPVTRADPLGLDWLDCMNDCVKKFDPLPGSAKLCLLGLGAWPKPFVTPGSTPYTNVPRRFFGLKGLGRSWFVRFVTIPSAVVYGNYLAGVEASCALQCAGENAGDAEEPPLAFYGP